MALIAHLSDLHLFQDRQEQAAIFTALVSALERERQRRGARFDLLCVSGDVFDDGALDPARAARGYADLHARIDRALGGDVPAVIVPGNHDRRRIGLFTPYREELFDALRSELAARHPKVHVHGCTTPFLSAVITPELHGLPLWIVAYDSTYLPRGLLSAGGMMRQEDLLHAASIIGDREPSWPVLFILHHHLVPTPLTDLHPVHFDRGSAPMRWALERALPWLVAHADREELTMTALGAGTAISTLHTLGRAVLVLHGHKHYATARLLDGTVRGHGDVLIVSAGSAGTAEAWTPRSHAARLWPSFNVIRVADEQLSAETVSFGYKGRTAGVPAARPLVRAARVGSQWRQSPIEAHELDPEPTRLAKNWARFTLRISRRFGASRCDYDCDREVVLAPDARLKSYVETIAADDEAVLELVEGRHKPRAGTLPTELELELGAITRYRVEGAFVRVLNGMHHFHADRHAPFAWVSLMNRYRSEVATLELEGLGEDTRSVFASATDLGNGLERPLRVVHEEGRAIVRYENCPPRTLLRAYWPLLRVANEVTTLSPGEPVLTRSPRPS